MSFDMEPDAPLHGECAAEIRRLEAENAKLLSVAEAGQAVIDSLNPMFIDSDEIIINLRAALKKLEEI